MLVLTCLTVLTLVGCDSLGGEHKHEFVKHEAKEPTCTEEGWLMYYTCSGCDEYTTFKAVPALGHDLGDYKKGETTHIKTCTRCSYTEELPHNWQKVNSVMPTCTEDGEQSLICEDCGVSKTEKLDAYGHSFSENYVSAGDVHTVVCTRCSYKESEAHEWKSAGSVAATCTEDGANNFTCDTCGATKSEKLSATGHSFSNSFKPNGDVHSKFCSGCDATINAPHTWTKVGVEKDPTCTEVGTEIYACVDCGGSKKVELPVVDEHIDGDWEIISSPTATVDGLKVLRCERCNKVIGEEAIPCDAKSMPILYFTGEYKNATNAKNEVEMAVTYYNPNGETFSAYATIKVQGSSSTAYDKKNYTVKFYKDETFDGKLKYDFGWGKESKYVIKANWVDFSQARNVVSCRLWGDIVSSRAASDNQKRLAALKTNGGAIDGFPISVYMNGEFYGLYTLNVPKDEWMFDMDDSETEALIAADNWNSTCFRSFIGQFKEAANGDIMSTDNGWELRYCGSDDYSWVAKSFDALIKFVQENDGQDFKNGIANYLDVDAAIDYFIFMYANCMHDNASKNMLWATYDGKTWIPSVYDQDGTFGQVWDGIRFESPQKYFPSVNGDRLDVSINYGPNIIPAGEPYFILWDKLLNNFTAEILARYAELRKGALSTEHMIAELKKFEDAIPASLFEADAERWADSRSNWWSVMKKQPGTWDYTKYHYEYMYEWVEQRMNCYDEAMQKIAEFIK